MKNYFHQARNFWRVCLPVLSCLYFLSACAPSKVEESEAVDNLEKRIDTIVETNNLAEEEGVEIVTPDSSILIRKIESLVEKRDSITAGLLSIDLIFEGYEAAEYSFAWFDSTGELKVYELEFSNAEDDGSLFALFDSEKMTVLYEFSSYQTIDGSNSIYFNREFSPNSGWVIEENEEGQTESKVLKELAIQETEKGILKSVSYQKEEILTYLKDHREEEVDGEISIKNTQSHGEQDFEENTTYRFDEWLFKKKN